MSFEKMVQGFKIPNLVDEYKTIFLEKWGKLWNFSKTFSLYLSFLSICFEVCQKPQSNLMNLEIMVQGFKKAKFVGRIQNYFSAKTRQIKKLFQNLLPIFEFPVNLFWSLSKALIESYELGNNGSRP